MISSDQTLLIFSIPFDQTLFVDHELLNFKRIFRIGEIYAQFELPGKKHENSLDLEKPESCITNITEYLPEKIWGLMKEDHDCSWIEACCIVVPIKADLPSDLSEKQFGGYDDLITKISTWFDSFSNWIWVFTTQSLNPVYPDPKVIHRKSKNIISFLATNGVSSIPIIQSPELKMIINSKGSESEKIVNREVLTLAIESAGTQPQLALELLASARMAAMRGDLRRALADAGTASELSLARIMNLDDSHRYTLGTLITKAVKMGYDIPENAQSLLVDLRNDAIHRGKISKSTSISKSLEIAENIVSIGIQNHIAYSTLKSVFRPITHNIVIIQPAKSNNTKNLPVK